MISDRVHALLMAIVAFSCAGVSLFLLAEVICGLVRSYLDGSWRR